MPDYSKGKIYKLVSEVNDEVYVGSTTKNYLCERLNDHKQRYKLYKIGKKITHYTAFDMLSNGSVKIVLIENYPCNSKDALLQREDYYINKLIDEGYNVVNKRLKNFQTKDEKIAYTKEYYQKNKKKMNAQTKINKRRWRSKPKNKVKEQQKAKAKEVCKVCGVLCRKYGMSKHRKTKNHQHIENLNKKREEDVKTFYSICNKMDTLLELK